MPLDLHPNCKSRLVETLTDALSALTVLNNQCLDYTTAGMHLFPVEMVLPKSGPLRTRLEDLVDEFPLSPFIRDELSRKLLSVARAAAARRDGPSNRTVGMRARAAQGKRPQREPARWCVSCACCTRRSNGRQHTIKEGSRGLS